MKVRELMTRLSALDPELEVLLELWDYDGGVELNPVGEVDTIPVFTGTEENIRFYVAENTGFYRNVQPSTAVILHPALVFDEILRIHNTRRDEERARERQASQELLAGLVDLMVSDTDG